jgi:hypothetical protein
MQFKRQGNKIQVLVYRGYDKEKRRSVVKMVGSYDVYSYKLSDGLLDSLTDKEREELQSHIETERLEAEKRSRLYSAENIASRIKSAADMIRAGEFEPPSQWADEVWAGIDALAKALRRAGYPRNRQRMVEASMPAGQAVLPMEVGEPTGLSSSLPPGE